jgi:hypothetical protein
MKRLLALLVLAACGQGAGTMDADDPLVLDVRANAGGLTAASLDQLREHGRDSGPTTIRYGEEVKR